MKSLPIVVKHCLLHPQIHRQFPNLVRAHQLNLKDALSRWQGRDVRVLDRRVYVVCRLAVFEDLLYSPAISQLLKSDLFDISLILTVPTEEAAAHAMAQSMMHDMASLLACFIPDDKLQEKLAFASCGPVIELPALSAINSVFLAFVEHLVVRHRSGVVQQVSECAEGIVSLERLIEERSADEAELALMAAIAECKMFRTTKLGETPPAPHHVQTLGSRKVPLSPVMNAVSGSESVSSIVEGQASLKDIVSGEGARQLVLSVVSDSAAVLLRLDLEFTQSRLVIPEVPRMVTSSERIVDFVVRSGKQASKVPLKVRAPVDRYSSEITTCYLNRGGGGNPVINAFAKAINAKLRYADEGRCPGISIVWGVLRGSKQIIDEARNCDQPFFYIDHAYFNRGHGVSYRITRDGFEAGEVRKCPPDRLNSLDIRIKPWHTDGTNILVCPPTEFFMEAHNCPNWLQETIEALKKHTDRPIVIREKPKPGESIEPLDVALKKAHALVTHSSNVAIESVVAGTPVFVSPTSAAAPVGLTDLSLIETPRYPDRDNWLAHLGYSQFSLEEIESGQAWALLKEFENRPFA